MKLPDFTKHELIPVIIQDSTNMKVLMLGYMNEEAYKKTVEMQIVHFYSRSRKRLWKKGESSGHIQKVNELYFDCDEDTLLIQVEQVGGAACHKGYESCFYRKLKDTDLEIVGNKIFDPKEVYK